jgi:hypothetical protein
MAAMHFELFKQDTDFFKDDYRAVVLASRAHCILILVESHLNPIEASNAD